MTTARWMLLAVLLAPVPALALEEPQCLSQSEVTGAYKRYHIVNGRQCWYAATQGAPAKPNAEKPVPEAQSATTEADPYGDPIWQAEGKRTPAKPRQAKPPVGGPLILNPSSAYSR
jgi:hypothetical protein